MNRGNARGLQPGEIGSGGSSLRRRKASDRPAGANKRKRDEDVIDGLKTANKRAKTRDSAKPEATARPRVEHTGDEDCRISGEESHVSKEGVIQRCLAWILPYHLQLCDSNC